MAVAVVVVVVVVQTPKSPNLFILRIVRSERLLINGHSSAIMKSLLHNPYDWLDEESHGALTCLSGTLRRDVKPSKTTRAP